MEQEKQTRVKKFSKHLMVARSKPFGRLSLPCSRLRAVAVAHRARALRQALQAQSAQAIRLGGSIVALSDALVPSSFLLLLVRQLFLVASCYY